MCMTHVGGPETIVEIENRERQEGAAGRVDFCLREVRYSLRYTVQL